MVKYMLNGRTYRLRAWFPFFNIRCHGCAFSGAGVDKCPRIDKNRIACTRGDGINRVWREAGVLSRVAVSILTGERDRYNR